MVKKIIFVLFVISFYNLWAEESTHERLGVEKQKKYKIELDVSCITQLYAYNNYNTYSISPYAGFNFTVLNDYVFSISQPITIKLFDISTVYKDAVKNGIKVAVDDPTIRFVWKPSYRSWRFQLGTDMTLPIAPYKQKTRNQFVTGSGRFAQTLLFHASYISDPVIVGGKASYGFVTPQLSNTRSGWVPCIAGIGIDVTVVLNNYFSVFCAGEVSWNSGALKTSYKAGQSALSESIQMQIAWQKKKWALSSFIRISYRERLLVPTWGIGYTRILFEK